MKNIAILTSGDAPCMKALAETFASGDRFRIVLLVTDRENSPALENAGTEGIDTLIIPRESWRDRPEEAIGTLKSRGIEVLVLDRFLPLLDDKFTKAFPGAVIDVTRCDSGEAIRAITAHLTDENAVDRQWADVLGLDFDAKTAAANRQPETPPLQQAPDRSAPQTPRGYVAPSPGQYYPGMPPRPYMEPRGSEPYRMEPMPPTNLLWAILCTIFCCFVPGIVAIIFSSLVSSRYYARDFEGSRRASRIAEYWIIASIVLGVISMPFYWVFMMS